MKKILSLLTIAGIAMSTVDAQEYVQLMQQPDANFYDIQKAFYEHWDGKTYEKGKGWKQFKRWEYFMEPRVYPTGKLNPSLAFEEHVKFQAKYTSKKGPQDKAGNWTPLGPNNWNSIGWNPGIGRINAITVDPNNSNVIYVGAPAGGCWKTTNGGNTWTPLTDDLASLGVSGIAIDPTNSNVVYIATGDGDGNDTYSIGVLKSTDGGTTWNTTGLNWNTTQSRVMRKIIIDPNNPQVLFVASSNGLYKTTDGGGIWTKVLGGSIRDVEFNPLNTGTMFACTNTNFYKSTNAGNSFVNVNNGTPASGVGRLAIGVTPDDTNYVYLLAGNASDNGFLGLYRSVDAGNTFSLRTNSPNIFGWNVNGTDNGGQAWYDMAIAVSPNDRNMVFTGGVNVWRTLNGGISFSAISRWNWPTGSYEYTHADIHSLDFYGNSLFCGSDGGIFLSTDFGGNFSDLTSGIQNGQYYRLSSSAVNPGIIMGGTQDNGSFMLKNGQWTHVTGGDGMECIADWSNSNVMYTSSQYGNLYKSTDGGNSFNGITGSISASGAWVSPYEQDPVNPNTIYLGYHDIWKTTNGGNTWNTISNFSAGGDLKSLKVAPSNNSVIYAASDFIVWKTTNGGASWTDVTSNLPGNVITYLTVHNTNPNILWASLSGFTAGQKVYQSTDGGASWTNISGNLPNLPINCVVYENGSNNGVYVGTDVGVYYKNDDMSLWQSYMDGLPNVMVYELDIQYATGKLRAATYGRGIWESDLFAPSAPTAQFYSPDTLLCPNACAKFYNTTPFLGLNWTWYFPGGTPSTSTDLNPVVCYPTTGTYDVSLIVYNAQGSDSIYEPAYVTVQVPSTGVPIPITEGFENNVGIPANWTVLNADQGPTWEHNSFVGGNGVSPSSFFIDNFSTDFTGEKDYLITPALDFTSITSASMTFDVAYALWSVARPDTLSIYYSDDCGVTKNLLYQKSGNDLATAPNLPLFFTPSNSQWRNDTVSLNALAGMGSVQLFIENRSANGNALYLDNINIFEDTGVGLDELLSDEPVLNLYPNPFNDLLTISVSNSGNIQSVRVLSVTGQEVMLQTANTNRLQLDMSNVSEGVYFVIVSTEKGIVSNKVLKF